MNIYTYNIYHIIFLKAATQGGRWTYACRRAGLSSSSREDSITRGWLSVAPAPSTSPRPESDFRYGPGISNYTAGH